jgi:hypothetical protein
MIFIAATVTADWQSQEHSQIHIQDLLQQKRNSEYMSGYLFQACGFMLQTTSHLKGYSDTGIGDK